MLNRSLRSKPSSFRPAALRGLSRALLLALPMVFSACPATAGGIEDRANDAPTGRYWAYNISVDKYKSILAQGNRCVDIEIVRTSPSTLITMAYVPNTGSFKKAWWWGIGLTSSQLVDLINTKKARLTDLECYEVNGGLRFAALLEANSTNGKGWWWKYNASLSSITTLASNVGARIVDIERYKLGSKTYYAAVLLKNAGQDATAWWYHLGGTWNAIKSSMQSKGAKLWDLDRIGPDNYNAIMVKWTSGYQWRFFGLTASQVPQYMNQYGARIIDIEQYNGVANPRFNIVMTNAVGTITSRVRDAMQKKSDGWTGFYLEKLDNGNGKVLTSLNRSRVFEPASTLKTLHHVHAMRRVALGQISLNTPIVVNTTTTTNNSCPQAIPAYLLPLQQVLTGMMEQSNNAFTRAITDRFGMNNLNLTAGSLGMSDSRVNHHIGCGSPANTTTLVDLALLHERVAKGYLGGQRNNFYTMMTNSFNTLNSGYARGYLKAVIDQEASKVGLSTQQKNDFRQAMYIAGKGGSYSVGGKQHRSWFAFARLPFWQNGGVVGVEYATGSFVADAASATKARDAAATGAAEVLREEIHKAMQSLKTYAFGKFTSFGSSCAGSKSPWTHSATGTPELGQDVYYRATANRVGLHSAMMYVGTSKTFLNRAPLPFHMDFLGAPGCYFRTNAVATVPMKAVNGKATLKVKVPVNKSLIGAQLHTQFLIFDRGANQANLLATNGLTTLVGGQK